MISIKKYMARLSRERPKMIVYRNSLYTITIGESQLLEGVDVYICTNNHTGVVEAEEQMLPRIIDYAEQLNEKVVELITSGMDIYPDERVTITEPCGNVQ